MQYALLVYVDPDAFSRQTLEEPPSSMRSPTQRTTSYGTVAT